MYNLLEKYGTILIKNLNLMTLEYSIKSEVFQYSGHGGWYFDSKVLNLVKRKKFNDLNNLIHLLSMISYQC